MVKKCFFIMICYLFLGILLLGCQSDSSKADKDDADKTTIKLWNNVAAGRSYFPILIEKFEKEHPDIKVELNNLNVESSEAEYQAAISDRNLPDIFSTDAFTLNEFVDLDLVHELNEVFPKDVQSQYTEGVFDEGNASLNGNVYLFPVYKGGTYYMFYNKQVLNDLGIDEVPKTWKELKEVGIEIYDQSNGSSYGLIFGGQSGWLVRAVTQLMATELSPESGYDYANGDYKYDTEGYVETIKLMKDLLDSNALSPSTLETDSTVARELFTAGQAAFLIDGNWTGQLLHENGFDDWGVVPLPTKNPNGQQYGEFRLGSNDGLYVSKDTEHWDEVKLFLEFLQENIYREILKDGEPLIAKEASDINVELPFSEVNDIAQIFSEMSVRVPNPVVVNPKTQEVRLALQKNAPDNDAGSILMGYLTGQVEDLQGALTDFTDDYNAAFTKAIQENENVSREDFQFPNWVPYEPYTEKEYQELK
ncbi:extracellular solute-binding protein [Virgibacillus sp. AGTR]|uniref:ABC transporter substrate-binding protein n=1 Tax=unclassified Virgibacillus TaxID=2620237 RepID=UPI000EF44FDB|nr:MULTISPECIES: extracellular solute-binding protein [unclassified Virgibacillus]MCC2248634.1 extracellular solute-binding protein [Virgibacillus sp. AGTR]MDY7043162.1 extracellular solute-binding protein [Virgibacillus sp. M23]QRZ18389.1 extracellular solute-binding protein [Virgibacillus sp. AGTR]